MEEPAAAVVEPRAPGNDDAGVPQVSPLSHVNEMLIGSNWYTCRLAEA